MSSDLQKSILWTLAIFFILFNSALIAQEAQPEVQEAKPDGFSIRDFKPWLDGNNASGNWDGFRAKCIDRGIELGVSSMNEVWGNTTGGIKTGSVATGSLQLATALDFEKLMGWQGGSFYSRWILLTGQDPSANLVGDIFTVSNIYGYNTFRNTELWLQQKFLNDQFSLRAGQLVADAEFAISDYAALFLNSTFGWPAFIYTSIPNTGPNYPVGMPGVRFEWKPSEQFLFRAAAFQGNPQSQNINNHGFYWELNSEQGFFYIAESAFKYDLGLPGQIKAGSWFNTATFPNANGSNSSFWGNYGIYGIIDQMIYRKPVSASKAAEGSKNVLPSGVDDGKKIIDVTSEQGLGVFSRIAFEPEDRNLFSFYWDSGLDYKGLLPTRNQDTMGIALGYGQLGSSVMNNQQIQYTSSRSGEFIQLPPGISTTGFEMVVETTYVAQLTPWLAVQPDIQYVIHPGAIQTQSNALVLGLRATVTF